MDSATGLTLNENIGNIYLKDVEFAYRSRFTIILKCIFKLITALPDEAYFTFRPNINVLNKLIASVKRGEKIALVGSTGCGKSTVIKGENWLNEYMDTKIFVFSVDPAFT